VEYFNQRFVDFFVTIRVLSIHQRSPDTTFQRRNPRVGRGIVKASEEERQPLTVGAIGEMEEHHYERMKPQDKNLL